MTEETSSRPAEVLTDLVRSSPPFELARGDGMPKLVGRAATFDEWTEIKDPLEGHFWERFAFGSFAKTIQERGTMLRCLFHHGEDNVIGVKPLGPITSLVENRGGLDYEVQMLDTDYNRSLIPGLEAGLYGSSFRFGIVKKQDDAWPRRSTRNPDRIPERTVTEAFLREFGPTPFPHYAGTTAEVRSLTSKFILGREVELLRRAFHDDEIWRLLDRSDEPPAPDEAPVEPEAEPVDEPAEPEPTTEDAEPAGDETQGAPEADEDALPEGAGRSHSARGSRTATEPLYTGKRREEAWRL